MAKKSRVQAPARRAGAAADGGRRQRLLLYAFAASGIVALAIVIAVVSRSGGGGSKDAAAALKDAGCTLRTYPGQNPAHVVGTTAPKWNSYPPATGPHSGETAIYGFYDEPVPLVNALHNHEHGGVAIWWGAGVPKAEVERLRALYDEDPRGIVASPQPKLDSKFALTAWGGDRSTGEKEKGYVATCPKFDEEAFKAFLDAHRFKGPERLPPDQLQPGGG